MIVKTGCGTNGALHSTTCDTSMLECSGAELKLSVTADCHNIVPRSADTWAQWPVASHTAGPGSTCRPLIPLTNTSTTVRKQTQTCCANNIYRVGSKTSINNRCCKSWCNLVNIVSSYQCIFYEEQQKWQQHCAVLWPH